ncbi:MAG TPA: 7TM diverse intracellular signaling domain-containing protein [bacterium]|nr:7TM diverse intracellular signaling domain-containing protein [bacterium]
MKIIKYFLFLLSLSLTFFALTDAFGAQSLLLDENTRAISLSRVLEYYVDSDNNLILQDFLSEKSNNLFRPGNGKTYNFGFRRANYWVRFTLRNQDSENREFLLIYNYPFIKRIELYLPQLDGSYRQVTGGCYHQLPDIGLRHRNHVFRITVPAGEEQTYYMMFSSDTTFLMDLRLQSTDYFNTFERDLSAYLSIIFGIFVMLSLIHFRNYLLIRDKINLLFFIYIISFVFYLAGLTGYGNQFFWPQTTWWKMNSMTLFAGATLACGVLFSRKFLQIKKYAPRSDRWLLTLSLLFFLTLGLLFFNPLYSHYLSSALAMFIILVIMHTTWRVWKQGYQPARLFFIAWLMFIVGGFVFFMTLFGVIIPSLVTLHSLHLGFAVGVIILAFALDERVNLLHQIAQEKISRVVDERTRELDLTVQTMRKEIEERKRVEGELRESKNLFQIVFQTIPDPVSINRLRDGVCVAVNEGFCRNAGYSAEDVVGRTMVELGVWRSDEERKALVQEVQNKGYVENMEAHLCISSGEVKTVLISSRLLHIDGELHNLTTARDITERKAAETALDEKHSQLQSLLSAIPDMVYFKDILGRILIVNKAFADMLGLGIHEIIGRMDEEIMPADMLELNRQGDTLAISQRTPIRSEEKGSTVKGNSRYYDTIRVPIFDSEDRLIGLLGVSRDITERKKSEEDKRRLEEQLMQSQKMEAIGRLAGGVAHDFNNILTGITGYAEMVMSELEGNGSIRDEMSEILRAADRAAALIQQLLAFSRKQIISPKVVQLNELIQQSQKMLVRIIGEDIRFSFRPADGLWQIKIDAVQIDQILVNLAANARDAMPNGGSLIIETRNISFDRDNAQQFRGMAPGDYVLLTVTDTGAGMDEETKERIFEPFFSTKAINKGTGLGLSTVYGVVKQNDGFINVYSEPGQGTTFRIYLPRSQEEPGQVHQVNKAAAPTGTELVMVVEDEMMVRSLVRKVLMRHGYQVLMANNGEEALALMDRLGRPIDLLLTDVVMPQMNGKDLYRQLVGRQPHLKVLYMSGYTEDVIAHHGVLERGTRFIQKPFSIDVLLQEVRAILDSDD